MNQTRFRAWFLEAQGDSARSDRQCAKFQLTLWTLIAELPTSSYQWRIPFGILHQRVSWQHLSALEWVGCAWIPVMLFGHTNDCWHLVISMLHFCRRYPHFGWSFISIEMIIESCKHRQHRHFKPHDRCLNRPFAWSSSKFCCYIHNKW